MLRKFIATNREQILDLARVRVTARSGAAATDRTQGLPVFLDQLGEALRKASSHETLDHTEIQVSAHQHGHNLFHDGLTVDQVVHDYGDLCQVITGLANEQKLEVPVQEFQTLNLCLDDAIAGAVTAYSQDREGATTAVGTERLGVLAHEMRNLLNAAILSFESIRRGIVSPGGSTGAIHARSLVRLNTLIDRSLADVRLEVAMHNVERLLIREIIEDVGVAASLDARTRGIQLVLARADETLAVDADRQILAAAVANLLQNALKFTAPSTTVKLDVRATATRVLIEVEDECGGLPPEKQEVLLRPFTQRGRDRTGLGLGLSICLKAMKSMGGALRIRDVPGRGCVFTIDLPRQPPASLA
jgi:signal transduction histidine kinase